MNLEHWYTLVRSGTEPAVPLGAHSGTTPPIGGCTSTTVCDTDGSLVQNRQTVPVKSKYLSEAFNLYRNLASKAGGHLTCQLRQQIPFEPSGPISWWLSFMWNLGCPPSEEDLLQPNDVENVYRLISCEPFLDSANAIEAFGLHLPDSVENMKGNPKGSNSDEILVTVKQIARMVHLEEKSIGSHTKKNWPEPSVPKSGQRPAQYKWEDIRPVLVNQFPNFAIPVRP
jgi:hypothetical protein